jgi:hypothetical protein
MLLTIEDMLKLLWLVAIGMFRSKASLEAEILTLRHQLTVLKGITQVVRVLVRSIALIFAHLYRIAPSGRILPTPILGGLPHQYVRV